MLAFPQARRLGSALLLLSWLTASVALPARADVPLLRFSGDGTAGKIDLPVGQSRVFRTAVPIGTLVIGDPEVAEAVLLTEKSFYLLGRGLGQTNVTVFGDSDWPAGIVDVEVGVDLADLRLALSQAAPRAKIDVQTVNGRLRLAGSAPDAVTLTRVLEIAEQYGSDRIINAVHVEAPQQVLLEVRIVEASRNIGRDLGINLLANRQGNTLQAQASTRAGLLGGALPFGSFLAQILTEGLRVDLLIDALERRGLVRSLAEPNLTALSGETASFLAGGEVPIPVATNNGEVTVEYKEFGVRLSFTPVVLGDGLINLRLEPEVSQVDFSTAIEASGISLPGFTTRRASTTVELADGQSFAIAGLLESRNTKRQDQVPWLGNVPVLGVLFRSASFQKQETDLVIIVTPRLARPAGPGLPLATPLDSAVSANDVEFFLLGKQEVGAEVLSAISEGRGVNGPYGHIIDLPGRSGHGL